MITLCLSHLTYTTWRLHMKTILSKFVQYQVTSYRQVNHSEKCFNLTMFNFIDARCHQHLWCIVCICAVEKGLAVGSCWECWSFCSCCRVAFSSRYVSLCSDLQRSSSAAAEDPRQEINSPRVCHPSFSSAYAPKAAKENSGKWSSTCPSFQWVLANSQSTLLYFVFLLLYITSIKCNVNGWKCSVEAPCSMLKPICTNRGALPASNQSDTEVAVSTNGHLASLSTLHRQ